MPGGLALLCAVLFAMLVPRETEPPARRPKKSVDLPPALMARALAVMTLAAISSSLIFNFTTNGNGQLLSERLRGLIDDPATLGVLLAIVYTIASLAQLVVGKLIDRYPLKWVYLPIVAAQAPLFLLAAPAGGWPLYAAVLAFMIFVFGAIPFVDAMIVQYVDDRMRSRVAGIRLAMSGRSPSRPSQASRAVAMRRVVWRSPVATICSCTEHCASPNFVSRNSRALCLAAIARMLSDKLAR